MTKYSVTSAPYSQFIVLGLMSISAGSDSGIIGEQQFVNSLRMPGII